MAFTQKIIQVNFTSGGGAFSPIQLSGMRIFCHTLAMGGNSLAQCDVQIYGMTLAHMNQLSTLGWRVQKPGADQLDVYAGDALTGMSHVYRGTIFVAYSDFQGGPNVPFHVVAHMGSREAGMVTKPTSINSKSADVAQIMGQLAGTMGLQFENNNVNVKIAYPYLPGSPKNQAFQLAKHANIYMALDRGKLAIWPRDGNRSGNAVTGPGKGLVGYPSWSSEGIRLKMLYSPDLMIGGQITVQGSVITPANGTWTITRLEHSLQAFTPDGEWFSNVQGAQAKPGQSLPAISG